MAFFLIYIIKSSCCLVLFYLGYKLLLSHETFFHFNRKVLLTGMATCLLLPLIKIETTSTGIIQQPFIELEKMIIQETAAPSVENISPQTTTIEPAEKNLPLFRFYCVGLYMIGISITFSILFLSFLSLCLLITNGRRIKVNNYVIILADKPVTPFNWWRYIVLSETDYRMYPDEILSHELAHYHKRHSWDLLFAECIILIHWFNPAAWLLKRELQEVHEYQADSEVLKQGIDATKYQLLLVKKAVGSSSYTFANSFNQSKLKKRITMMFKKQSNQWARLKLLLLIPAATYTLYAFARPDVNRQLKQLIPSEDTIIPQEDKKYTPEFFESELNAWLTRIYGNDDLSRQKKETLLKEQTNITPLLVNSTGKIMFKGEYTSIELLPARLAETLLATYPNKKPVTISFQHDRASSYEMVDKVFQITGKVFADYADALKAKQQPPLLYYATPKNIGAAGVKVNYQLSDSQQSFIQMTATSGDSTRTVLIYPDDSKESITEKIKSLPAQNDNKYVTVSLKASPDTPMGNIIDLKNILREVYARPIRLSYSDKL